MYYFLLFGSVLVSCFCDFAFALFCLFADCLTLCLFLLHVLDFSGCLSNKVFTCNYICLCRLTEYFAFDMEAAGVSDQQQVLADLGRLIGE